MNNLKRQARLDRREERILMLFAFVVPLVTLPAMTGF